MRTELSSLAYLGWLARFRSGVAVALFTCAAGTGLVGRLAVPNPQGDAGVPWTRVSILLACLVASLLVLLVRSPMPVHERLSSRRLRPVRGCAVGIACVLVLAVVLASSLLILGTRAAGGPAGVVAGLCGIGLLGTALGTYPGMFLPWAYAMAGLAFGYTSRLDHVELAPWAWLVSSDERVAQPYEFMLLAAGIVVCTVAPRRRV